MNEKTDAAWSKEAQVLVGWGVLWFLFFAGIGTCNYLSADAKFTIDTLGATPAPTRMPLQGPEAGVLN